jgi:ESF2/ABP1 family protein
MSFHHWVAYEKRQKELRLRTEIQQAKRENKIYLENVAKSKMVNALESKRKRKEEEASAITSEPSSLKTEAPVNMDSIRRQFKQRKVVHDVDETPQESNSAEMEGVFSKLFG